MLFYLVEILCANSFGSQENISIGRNSLVYNPESSIYRPNLLSSIDRNFEELNDLISNIMRSFYHIFSFNNANNLLNRIIKKLDEYLNYLSVFNLQNEIFSDYVSSLKSIISDIEKFLRQNSEGLIIMEEGQDLIHNLYVILKNKQQEIKRILEEYFGNIIYERHYKKKLVEHNKILLRLCFNWYCNIRIFRNQRRILKFPLITYFDIDDTFQKLDSIHTRMCIENSLICLMENKDFLKELIKFADLDTYRRIMNVVPSTEVYLKEHIEEFIFCSLKFKSFMKYFTDLDNKLKILFLDDNKCCEYENECDNVGSQIILIIVL